MFPEPSSNRNQVIRRRPNFLNLGRSRLASGDRPAFPTSQGTPMLDFLLQPKTRRIDWWAVALLLVTLVGLAGGTIRLFLHSVLSAN